MKPTLRTETLTERRLKRQLRRFITIEMVCEKQAEAFCKTIGSWDKWSELKRLNFTITAYKFQPLNSRAKTPQEKRLKDVYAQVVKVARAYQFSRLANVDTSLSRLVNISKRALHTTRRDKELS